MFQTNYSLSYVCKELLVLIITGIVIHLDLLKKKEYKNSEVKTSKFGAIEPSGFLLINAQQFSFCLCRLPMSSTYCAKSASIYKIYNILILLTHLLHITDFLCIKTLSLCEEVA